MNSGSIANRYDYSPFGQLSKNNETVANPFKFSSEYAEKETGLIYYNYRYYNPVNGKWLKRDPIGERGGMNVYGFVNNNPIYEQDYLGLFSYDMPIDTGRIEFGLFWVRLKINIHWEINVEANSSKENCPTKLPNGIRDVSGVTQLSDGLGWDYKIGVEGDNYKAIVGFKMGITTSGDNALMQFINLERHFSSYQEFEGEAQVFVPSFNYKGIKTPCACIKGKMSADFEFSYGQYDTRVLIAAGILIALAEPTPAGELTLAAAGLTLFVLPPFFE
ncbi:RHS repeat-associated core domain-containing protein [Lentisphaerota bacterium WC36G]|nr:RHS repeat-associated core domain-containing protein [Lentisphaerae bacterium WC36]